MKRKDDNVVFKVRRDNVELSYSPVAQWQVTEYRQTKKGEYSSQSYFPYLDMALRKIVEIKAAGLKNSSENQAADLKTFEDMLNVLKRIDTRLKQVHILTPVKAINAVMG